MRVLSIGFSSIEQNQSFQSFEFAYHIITCSCSLFFFPKFAIYFFIYLLSFDPLDSNPNMGSCDHIHVIRSISNSQRWDFRFLNEWSQMSKYIQNLVYFSSHQRYNLLLLFGWNSTCDHCGTIFTNFNYLSLLSFILENFILDLMRKGRLRTMDQCISWYYKGEFLFVILWFNQSLL